MYYEEYLPVPGGAEAAKVVASRKLNLPSDTTYKPFEIKKAIEHAERGGKILLDFNPQNNAFMTFLSNELPGSQIEPLNQTSAKELRIWPLN
jgi:hypothetical protein